MWSETHHAQPFIRWLASYLQARDLRRPDGRPLYEYQTSVVEYQQLKALLTQQLCAPLAAGRLSERSLSRSSDIAACFVLFCAEWYRREYQSHWGWAWEPVWHELGFSVSPAARGDLVTLGLVDFWGRELSIYSQAHRNFLGSIFREGGLPFLSLKESGNRFRQFFSQILKRYKGYKNFGYSTSRLVADRVCQAGLPRVFQEEESVALLAAMADELVTLVDFYALEEQENPAQTLDQLKPGWRNSFPIPLDADTGRDFINVLLQSASKELKDSQRRQQTLDCTHYFVSSRPDQLFTEISFPNELAITLQGQVDSSRLEVAIYEGTELLRDLGPYYAEHTEHGFKIRNWHPSVTVSRQAPNRRLRLTFSIYGNKVTQLEIPNSFIDVGDVPLGFVADDEGNHVLAGQASFRVKEPNMQLWVPADARLQLLEGDYDTLQCLPEYRRLQLLGPCRVKIKTDELFNIVSGARHELSQRFTLSGNAVSWSSRPAAVFIGIPRAVPISTAAAGIEQDELLWSGFNLYLSGQPQDVVAEQNNYGVHYLSLRNEQGESVLRRKVGVLPPDFELVLGRGDSPQSGYIWLHSQYDMHYELLDEGIESFEIYDQNNPVYEGLQISCAGNPPPTVRLSLRFGTADPIVLTLPFPSTGFLAFDSQGRPLPRNITLDNLLGTRLYLFGSTELSVTEYDLALSLRGERPLNLSIPWKIKVQDTPAEIELFPLKDELEQLLSLQRGIDRYVELTVNNRPVCRIRRYAVDLRLDQQRWLLEGLNDSLAYAALPEPMLMCLSEPELNPLPVPPRQSQGVSFPVFDLPADLDTALPWLLIPKEGSALSFRPELIHFFSFGSKPDASRSGAPELNNIRQVLRDYGPQANAGPLDEVMARMATEGGHKGWHYIKTLYEKYGYLPLATFAAWLALMRNPRAIAMAAFHFEMNPAFVQRLARRFPFTWELFPIRNFLAAERDFFHYLSARGLPERMQDALRQRFYERLAEAIPCYGEAVLQWLLNGGGGVGVPPVPAMQQAIDDWYRTLLRDRAKAVWPVFPGHMELKRWALQQNLCMRDVELNHRNTVVYMPYFAAAVAAGKADRMLFSQRESELIFYLRQARDFDSHWFYAVYQYALLHFLQSEH